MDVRRGEGFVIVYVWMYVCGKGRKGMKESKQPALGERGRGDDCVC